VPAVVLDSNVALDWLVFDDPAVVPLAAACRAGHVHWVATAAMVQELAHVLHRGSLQRWQPDAEHVLRQLAALCTVVETPAAGGLPAPVCTDRDDQKFIDFALAWPARWLLTRDKALLRLARAAARRGTTVCSPAAWSAAWATSL
jgi:putative PIN family toxin of toxin-antitoxin system